MKNIEAFEFKMKYESRICDVLLLLNNQYSCCSAIDNMSIPHSLKRSGSAIFCLILILFIIKDISITHQLEANLKEGVLLSSNHIKSYSVGLDLSSEFNSI